MDVQHVILERRAVSSVVSTVLMVAIVIVLAAAIGTFVLGIGAELTSAPPSAEIDVVRSIGGAAGTDTLTLTKTGGDDFAAAQVRVERNGVVVWTAETGPKNGLVSNGATWSGTVTSGDELALKEQAGTDSLEHGDTITVIWTSTDGKRGAVLVEAVL